MFSTKRATTDNGCTISTEVFASSLQFTSCMGSAAWSKFSPIYFMENGVTPGGLAIMGSVQAVAKLIGYPTFGAVFDYIKNSKALLMLTLVLSNLILLLFYFPATKSLIFSNFALLAFVRGARSYFNCIWSLVDALIMKIIADKKDFGKHRLFGSLAWGLNGLVVGRLIDLYGMDMIFAMGIFWSAITFVLIVFCMPQHIDSRRASVHHKFEAVSSDDTAFETHSATEHEEGGQLVAEQGPSRTFKLCQTLKLLVSIIWDDRQFLLTLLVMVVYWNAMFIVDRVLFIEMQQELGATKFMNGIATFCSTMPAIPCFYYSSNLMHNHSLNALYGICHFVLFVRLFAYLLCTDLSGIWWIYAVELLHGINFGVGFAVCSVYLYHIGEVHSNNNPHGINVKATVQSLKGIITLISILTGSVIWLPLYEAFNGATVYVLGAVTLMPNILVLWLTRSADHKLLNVHA